MKVVKSAFCLFFLFSFCSTKKDFEPAAIRLSYTKELEQVGEPIRIGLDSVTLPVAPLATYIRNDSVNIILLNANNRVLQIYDLNSTRIVKRIEIPAKIDNPTHQYIHSRDSVFLIDSYKYTLFLINAEGQVLKEYPLLVDSLTYSIAKNNPPPPLTEENYVGLPFPDNRNPVIKTEPYLILRTIPWIDPFNQNYFDLGKLRLKINLDEPTDISYFLRYPIIFRNENKFPTKFFNESSTFNPTTRQIIIDFPAENYIYSTDINGVVIKKHWAGSEYFEKVNAMDAYEDNNIEQAEHAMNNSFYERILYDQFRNVYYRLVWHHDKQNKFSFQDSGKKFDIDLGVIILDDKLNKVGEVILPKHVTNTFWFVSKEGLFIQSNVDDNSYLSFQLFNLKDIK